MADNILTKDRASADIAIAAKDLAGVLLVPAEAPPARTGGGITTKPRRTVQVSNGLPLDNTAALLRARRRRRQQQFLAIHLLTH